VHNSNKTINYRLDGQTDIQKQPNLRHTMNNTTTVTIVTSCAYT